MSYGRIRRDTPPWKQAKRPYVPGVGHPAPEGETDQLAHDEREAPAKDAPGHLPYWTKDELTAFVAGIVDDRLRMIAEGLRSNAYGADPLESVLRDAVATATIRYARAFLDAHEDGAAVVPEPEPATVPDWAGLDAIARKETESS